ncbi:peptidoglycan DD-metalloendopeptidase family protein [Epibacterium sp. SM1979]|uniref:Peptidoglycan DD-metalloendopeptidase family protein n=1 Tax=Tritonibacter litoralis TaxID=2662264 RepID=A0A843YLW0_9RHOB|nr:peptidoglycan DD-metalloendopeptidase family protein [Tritonibacter litoralis]
MQSEDVAALDTLDLDASVFLNIKRAPMVIELPESGALGRQRMILDQALDSGRAPAGSALILIDDPLLDPDQTLTLTLPSSGADLAAFQKRRSATPQRPTNSTASDGASETHSTQTIVPLNTVTEAIALPAAQRLPLYQDHVFQLDRSRALEPVLQEAGLDDDEIQRILRALSREAEARELNSEQFASLGDGDILALRTSAKRRAAKFLQASFYVQGQYLLSLSQPAPGRFELSDDPWFSDNLLEKADRVLRARGPNADMRLKDALYTALLRNGMSSDAVGETMLMLSRATNLDRLVRADDTLRLLMSSDESLLPSARLLFIAVDQAEVKFRCYVVPQVQLGASQDAGAFSCFDPSAPQNLPAPGGLGAGYKVPVEGVKTSGFGSRIHPVTQIHQHHNGVDWAAPIGTPVVATASGTITKIDRSTTYGNIIYLSHDGGIESRYAHLDGFAEGLRQGAAVEQGQLIGYVGTTGRSTGPHLHFEMRLSGVPVDPLGFGTSGGSAAVEALVNRIIQVESAGNARAKNSRSSATGLGQFISSTWLRMMGTYRPDLAQSLSREELLELRFDPDLSRAMVTNLARENEAVLRAAGLNISPGRLYLAHFLGAKGAVVALRADPEASVLDTMGANVVEANPFLKGWTNAQMAAWADRKLSVLGQASAPVPRQIPVEVRNFQERLDRFFAAL